MRLAVTPGVAVRVVLGGGVSVFWMVGDKEMKLFWVAVWVEMTPVPIGKEPAVISLE